MRKRWRAWRERQAQAKARARYALQQMDAFAEELRNQSTVPPEWEQRYRPPWPPSGE